MNTQSEDIALRTLGEPPAPLIVTTNDTPTNDRLKEALEEGSVLRGFCINCGSYPEFPQESVIVLSKIGGFDLPPLTEMIDYYVEVNQCGVCKLKTTPSAVLKQIK